MHLDLSYPQAGLVFQPSMADGGNILSSLHMSRRETWVIPSTVQPAPQLSPWATVQQTHATSDSWCMHQGHKPWPSLLVFLMLYLGTCGSEPEHGNVQPSPAGSSSSGLAYSMLAKSLWVSNVLLTIFNWLPSFVPASDEMMCLLYNLTCLNQVPAWQAGLLSWSTIVLLQNGATEEPPSAFPGIPATCWWQHWKCQYPVASELHDQHNVT